MRRFLSILFLLLPLMACAQGYDQNRIALANFLKRMYLNSPFDGCRVVDDYDHDYLLSVVALSSSNYTSPTVMDRVAQVKSQRNAGEFFNGSQSYSELTIKGPNAESHSQHASDLTDVYEVIKVHSAGFVRQMQLLTKFASGANTVYIFYKQIDNESTNK